ncbi:EAL domain-containing protein [Neisseriaceae bacterium TC5R-5]|nr:EAL domain-containing protein [Neisseriaceae bacterium TC5R-5]
MNAFEHAGLIIGSHFQPIYSLAHRRSIGVEALLRAEQQGSPLEPLAAFNLMASSEQRHLLDLAVSNAHISRFQQLPQTQPLWLFLNLDSSTLARPERAMALLNSIRHAGLQPGQVVLEMLEHDMEVNAVVLESLALLKQHGFLIAIDNFNVSHSNLERICQLEPNLVKFNRQLLRSAVTQPRSRKLLHKLVRLTHDIGALVVEEGIETAAEVLVALESGCDLIQGNLVALPAALPDQDVLITPRIEAHWDEFMAQELLKRKLNRRQLELARQSFVQSAISLMQGIPFDLAAKPMLSLHDVCRCFLLDNEGRQLGQYLQSRQAASAANPMFAPLADTTGAVWSRRHYFQHAIEQPGVLYMSEPYLSMTDTRGCITISMAIEIDEAMHVLCADILVASYR